MKETEMRVNRNAQVIYERYIDAPYNSLEYVKRVFNCNAGIYTDGRGVYYLKSYSTFVAVVDTNKSLCVDYLRAVYGYTATSAQHIAKFFNLYAPRYKNYIRVRID